MAARDGTQAVVIEDGSFTGQRGRRIFWQRWSPAGDQQARGTVVVTHGYAEHLGRYGELAERLTDGGYSVWALDHHGHGRSEGKGAQIVLADAVADLNLLVSLAAEGDPEAPRFLLGHSLGGAIAIRYAIAYQDRLTGLVLTGPLAAIDEPAALGALLKFLGRVAPGLPITKLDSGAISRDPIVVARYRDDPLVHHRAIPAITAREMVLHVQTLQRDAAKIRLPALLLYGTADRLCPPRGAVTLANRIGSTDLTVKAYEGLYHEILNEPERAAVTTDIIRWLDTHTLIGV